MAALATFAVSAVASATASAAHEFKVEGKPITKSFALLGLGLGSFDLLGLVKKTKMHVKCQHVHLHGLLFFKELISHADVVMEVTQCTITEPAGCTVNEPIMVSTARLLIGTEGSPELESKPKEGTRFAEVEIGKCALKGKYNVEGSQICELPKASTETVGHEVVCKTSGSKLKFGGEPATFEGSPVNVELESKEKWSGI